MSDDFVLEGEIKLKDSYSDQIDKFERRIDDLQQRLDQVRDAGSLFDPNSPWEDQMRIGGIGGGFADNDVMRHIQDVGYKADDVSDKLQKLHDGLSSVGDAADKSHRKLEELSSKHDDLSNSLARAAEQAEKLQAATSSEAASGEIVGGGGLLSKLSPFVEKIGPALAGISKITSMIGELATGPLGMAVGAFSTAAGIYGQLEQQAHVGDVYRTRESALGYLAGGDTSQIQQDIIDAQRGYITRMQSIGLLLDNYMEVQGDTTEEIKQLGDVAATIVDFQGGKAIDVGSVTAKLAAALSEGNIGAVKQISGGLYDFTEQQKIWSAETGKSFVGLTDEERKSLLMQWMFSEMQSLQASGIGWENLEERTSLADVKKKQYQENLDKLLSGSVLEDFSLSKMWDHLKAGFWEELANMARPQAEREQVAQRESTAGDILLNEMRRMGITGPLAISEVQTSFERRNQWWKDNQVGTPLYSPREPGEVAPPRSPAELEARRKASELEDYLAQINQSVDRQLSTQRLDMGIAAGIMPTIVGANIMGSQVGYLQSQMPGFRGMLTDTGEWSAWIDKAKELPGISENVTSALDQLGESMDNLSDQQAVKAVEAMKNAGHEFQSLAEAFLGPRAKLEQLIGMFDNLPTNLQSLFQGRATMAAGEYIQERILGPERPNQTFSAVVGGAHQISNLLTGSYLNPKDLSDVSADEIAAAQKKILNDWVSFNRRLEETHSDSLVEMQVYRSSYLRELNELLAGNRKALEAEQDIYKKRMGLRSSATSVLMSRLTPSPMDFLATKLGEYQEAPMEEVRQLQDFIQGGADKLKEHLNDPNYQKSIKLLSQEAIKAALGGDDTRLKYESMKLQQQFLTLQRLPENLDNFDVAYKNWFEGQAAKERNMQTLEAHLKALGYSGDVGEDLKKFFGIETPEMELKMKFKATEKARDNLIKQLAGNDDGILDLPVKLTLAKDAKEKKERDSLASKLGVGVDEDGAVKLPVKLELAKTGDGKTDILSMLGVKADGDATSAIKGLLGGDKKSVSEGVAQAFDGFDIGSAFLKSATKQFDAKSDDVISLGKTVGGKFMHGVSKQVTNESSYIFKALVDAVIDAITKGGTGNGSGDGGDGSEDGESNPK